MKHSKSLFMALLLLYSGQIVAQEHKWTLQECIDYALEHNIQLRQKSLATSSSKEDLLQAKSAMLPSVSAGVSENMNYRPFAKETTTLEGGSFTTSSKDVSFNSSYNLSARWTIWNGGKTRFNIKQKEITSKQNEYAEEEQSNTIQEQITKLFVQILYASEAIKVDEEVLKGSRLQLERAHAMVDAGQMARVDEIQLEAQVAQDELSLVSAKNEVESAKLQLKQMLELQDAVFEVAVPEIDDSAILTPIPSKEEVFNIAIDNRPEIQSQKLNIENSTIALKSAKAGHLPSISLSSGLGTNNANGQKNDFSYQVKHNLSYSMGLSLSVPITSNREVRTNINKGKYSQETSQLQLQDAEKKLYSTIESYYLDASMNQTKYLYAKKNLESMQESYKLVNEQFSLGLKDIVDLTNGKNNLLRAEQQLLETKYTALYNRAMLNFYKGEPINL